jgi:YVTN family beta-propeller protein
VIKSWLCAASRAALFCMLATGSSAFAKQAAPIFVLNSLNANVSIVDPTTWTETARVPVGKEPHHIYLTPDEKSVLVANAEGDSITFMDPKTGKVQRTLNRIIDPYHLRFSPDMKWLVTAANRLDHIDIYRWHGVDAAEPLELVKRIPAGKTPSHIAIDSKSTVAYVTLQDSNELIAIDLLTQAPRWKVSTGKLPADLHLTTDDKTLLVGLTGEDNVQVFDVSSGKGVERRRITTGKGAHAFRAQGDNRHLFVSNRTANTISRIDLDKLAVVGQFAAPGGPDCMEMMADGRTLLVTSRWAGRLTVIDTVTGKVTQQVRVGKSPHGVWTLSHAPRQ